MTTADRIKNRRLELGLTQLEVAKRLGLSTKAAVSKVEKQGDNVTLKSVEKFALALHCAPAYLMGWSDEKYDEPGNENYHKTGFERTLKANIVENYSEFSTEEIIASQREKKFVELYCRLDENQKKLVDNLIETFLSKQ